MSHKPYPVAKKKEKVIALAGGHAIDGQDCTTPAPCGNACVLDAQKRHQYHMCVDGKCPHCHGGERFRTKRKAQ